MRTRRLTRSMATVVLVFACVLGVPSLVDASTAMTDAPSLVDASAGTTAALPPLATPCWHPSVPDWFHDSLVTSIHISRDLNPAWADSPYVAKLVCWQGSDFDVAFAPRGDDFHAFHGLFAMTVEEMEMIRGPWHIANRNGFLLSAKCFVWGWVKCARTPETSRTTQQEIAGLRWMWLTFGSPKVSWSHVLGTGRFSAFPRPGTDDTVTKTPLGLCPVDGSVGYRDDFGEPRHVGGYHPHWGNDMSAPVGRAIRAPFDGLAIAHSDNWFAGNSVGIIGAKGYVHNGHLSRFGALGEVTKGTIVGYVGETGDAESPHDHFEWHPWVVPTPLHQAPSGFSRVMDAIDPFPVLNQVCA